MPLCRDLGEALSKSVLSNPRAVCGPSSDFMWPGRVFQTFSNFCLTGECQHRSSQNDALNSFKVLKCTIRFRDSEASIPWFGKEGKERNV